MGVGEGLVTVDPLPVWGGSGGRDLENVHLGYPWRISVGLGRRAGVAPGRNETPPTAREKSCPAADAELSAPLGSPGCWVGAGRRGRCLSVAGKRGGSRGGGEGGKG